MDSYQQALTDRIQQLKAKKKEYKAQGKDITFLALEIHHIKQALWFSTQIEDENDE